MSKMSPEYDEMMRKNRALLDDIHKENVPWDYCMSLNYFIQHLRWMAEYYKLGENVIAMEKRDEDLKAYTNYPTRLESIQKTLDYYDKWQGLENEYIHVVEHSETYKEHENEDGTITIDDLGFHCTYKYGSMKKTYKKLAKAQKKYKHLFFKTLEKYLEEWWD